mmetsp:Transcript_63510/g.176069  ORF Transcript_63510/g.176069 Transcript_63510/m.176069 type:complete len:200 (+) Transcript_63510:517-1116(+)
MASTTGVSPKTPFLMMAWCWSMRVFSGTSSSLVHPPRGESQSTGFLKPLAFSFSAVSCMRSAWPLCTGLRSWKAKTASAPSSWNVAFSSAGVFLYSSIPSLRTMGFSTWIFPPTSQSPASTIILMYGWPSCVMPKVRPARSSFLCSYTSGLSMTATTEPSGPSSAICSLPSILAFSSAVHAFTMGTGMGTILPSITRCS